MLLKIINAGNHSAGENLTVYSSGRVKSSRFLPSIKQSLVPFAFSIPWVCLLLSVSKSWYCKSIIFEVS